jgi:orotate phosphoribosyltransferase
MRAASLSKATRLKEQKTVTEDQVLAEFRAAEALLEGHFILSSGLRSSRYLQCARVLADPARAARLAEALVATLPADLRGEIDIVVSPAMGGVIAGHEMGRALGVEALFVERPEGVFELRRGFRLKPGQKVLMMEDVVTTGLSSREAIKAIEAAGGTVIVAAALVDRSNGSVDLGVPFFPLIRLEVPTYEAAALPPELATMPAIKPGSRVT